MLGGVNRLASLGRHVVLIVLGQNLIGVEHAVGSICPCATHPRPSLNKSGKDSFVNNWNTLGGVSHDEARCQPIVIAIERSFSTNPPTRKVRPTGASFATTCEGLKKKNQILLEKR